MDKLTIFVALTGVAVALQAGVLLAMLIVMRSTSAKLEALANEVKTKILPTVEQAQGMIAEVRPNLQEIVRDVKDSTAAIRAQIQRTDATVNDIVDRARLQVIRADELLSRTLDRVEQTSEMVHKTVISPVRQLSGLMAGITAGLEFLFAARGPRNGDRRGERRPVPQDEMFI
jgi:chromatin segregation and condensation protein Rec8/ScpA/Scc1 (kleisin family)